jgi:hypothetical protein
VNTATGGMHDKATVKNEKFWEELIAYFPLIRHGSHRKRRLQQFFVAAGTSLPSWYLITKGRCTDIHTRPTILLLLRVCVAAGTCLSSCCLAMKCGIHFTEPLPSNGRRDTHTDTRTDGSDLRGTSLRWAQVS